MTPDEVFMNAALDLAEKGAGYVSPNPMVGAVVVKDGRIVGSGYHRAVGTAHAEVNALEDAGSEAAGATLYVTLEPCNHTGRTPPCTEKILKVGVKKVVVAMLDPNPEVRGGGNDRLRGEGVEVVTGVCQLRARKLNENFIKYSLTKRPFVILKSAATLDGRIATRTGDARWVTGRIPGGLCTRFAMPLTPSWWGSVRWGRMTPVLPPELRGRRGGIRSASFWIPGYPFRRRLRCCGMNPILILLSLPVHWRRSTKRKGCST